ncbi:hypothetical protein ACFSN5_03885 [Streptococcus tangpeifui]|uniref:hypothetical protein n=1 Tax=Streptococcus tangpeifui TaxID=2709400 RepID=UPI0013EA700F|nr:hypothetical protein [Streptococcus sp. ZJ373]
MKSPIKKFLLTSALAGAMLAASSTVSALGWTETNRYGTAPNPNYYRTYYDLNVHNVDINDNVIPTEGTDFTQYYWRGDSSSSSTTYDSKTGITTTTYFTVRYWEAK